MKKCNVCKKQKPLDNFYKGLAQCKPCYKAKVAKYRRENIERVREYDRGRGNRQPAGYLQERRKQFPNQYRAQNMVNNALRDGKLFKKPCAGCGSENRIHAHHDDYAEPLNIRWLCAACHKQWHEINGEGLNR